MFLLYRALVAQLDRAFDCGSKGQGFEFLRAHHFPHISKANQMKILFSPSELKTGIASEKFIKKENFIFPNLYEKRLQIVTLYNDFILNANEKALCKLFGTKKEKDLLYYRKDIFKSGCVKAILRYAGTAYKALQYRNLDTNSQKFIDESVLIFSNLFGVVSAKDEIPDYKLKQGESFLNLEIPEFYLENFSNEIDKFVENDDILDLRAGFYEKFYIPKKEYLAMKFIKHGKVLSHFAKQLRGEVLKEIAIHKLDTNEKILAHNFTNLQLKDIKKIKNQILITYDML